MKSLTLRNVVGLGFGVLSVLIIVDALPSAGSAALAQSPLVTNVTSIFESTSPGSNSPTAESLSNLLRVGERTFDVEFDPSVSQDVLSADVVRKVTFGNVSYVSVVTTPSGTYSTDGFASRHVQYPGINVVETTPPSVEIFLKVLVDGEFIDWSSAAFGTSGS